MFPQDFQFAADAVPSTSVATIPAIDLSAGTSSQVKRMRRQSGNDLLSCAFLCVVFATLMELFAFVIFPLAIVLHAVSLYLLVRILVVRAKPHLLLVALSIPIALVNVLHVLIGLAFLAGLALA